MAEDDHVIICCVFLIIAVGLSPPILHGYGMFGKEWVTATSCEALDDEPRCCESDKSSIDSTCHGPFGLDDLNTVVYFMQWIAFVLLILPSVWFMMVLWCGWDNDGACATYRVAFFLYLAAGLLSCIDCGIVAVEYSGQSFGESFRLCLFSGIYNLIIAGILTYCMFSTGECREETLVQRGEYNKAATQYEDV